MSSREASSSRRRQWQTLNYNLLKISRMSLLMKRKLCCCFRILLFFHLHSWGGRESSLNLKCGRERRVFRKTRKLNEIGTRVLEKESATLSKVELSRLLLCVRWEIFQLFSLWWVHKGSEHDTASQLFSLWVAKIGKPQNEAIFRSWKLRFIYPSSAHNVQYFHHFHIYTTTLCAGNFSEKLWHQQVPGPKKKQFYERWKILALINNYKMVD